MSLEMKISDDLKDAMRNKDTIRLETIRNIKSQMKYYQVEKKQESLTDEDVFKVINKLSKQRRDSIEQFTAANRTDLAEKEQLELDVLNSYLPKQMPEDELKSVVLSVKNELGINDKKQMGVLMKAVMAKVQGRADGKLVSKVVGEILV